MASSICQAWDLLSDVLVLEPFCVQFIYREKIEEQGNPKGRI